MLRGKYINKYHRKYWYLLLIGIIFLVAVDWIQLYVPEFLGDIVDLLQVDYSKQEVFKEVTRLSLYVLAVAFGMFIGRAIWRVAIFSASHRIEAGLREEMFEKAERLSRDFYHQNKVGTIMAWFSADTETVEEFFGWGTVMLIDAFFLSILVIVKMFLLDVLLSLICLIPILFIALWGALVEKFMSLKWEERQVANDKIYDFTEENFTGIRVIKAFVKENQEIRAFAKVARKNQQVNVSFVRISMIFDVVIEVIIAAIVALLLGFGGYLVYLTVTGEPLIIFSYQTDVTPGKLVKFIGYFSTLVWPMIALGQIVTMRARAKTSLKRITKFLDAPEDIKNPENAVVKDDIKGKITFKNFSFKYSDNSDEIDNIQNVSLEILPGEKVGIVGKVGCGKTTLANTLTRMFNVNKGQVFIDDIDIMDYDLNSIHKAIGYVPQDNFLFSDSIKNNIAFSNALLSDEDIVKAAQFADVDKDIKAFPDGYDTFVGERGVTLSGGQKQRVSIARAFIKDAPIMILDDSVSAVDVSTEEYILKNINEYRKGKTTIVIASRISTVQRFDKIIVLDEGRLEAFGSPKELNKTSELYKRMVKSQELQKEVEGGN